MKVLIVNTSESKGGAAVAARRLTRALRKAGINTIMLVRDKTTKSSSVVALKESFTNIVRFAWERIVILMHNGLDKKNLFAVSIANTGVDITKLPEYKEADIIHLHWINQGMISLDILRKILCSDKPIVWTMHDMWPATGICHHARECEKYTSHCGNCQFINQGKRHRDLAYKVFNRKRKIYGKCQNIAFVTCSQWLKDRVTKSRLTGSKQIICIPNPIDTSVFTRKSKTESRKILGLPQDKKLILFGSVKITDKRKGIDYLIEACSIFARKNPDKTDNIGVVVIGQNSEIIEGKLPFKVYSLQYVREEKDLSNIYNAIDTFVTPSLEENLPNMIMEAMACGIPCVGFNIGGIPEMIDHLHNGYVAEYKSADDLAKGIKWILYEDAYDEMSDAAIRKVHESYSEEIIAKKYIEVYNSLMVDSVKK